MALADLIKAFSLSDSSLKGSSATTTTTQVVGFLSVLAISGSVALLTFGCKLKLVREVPTTDASQPLKADGIDGLPIGESEPSEMERRDRSIRADGDASEPLKLDGRNRRQGRGKRVRFASDVVEPRGNSQEYRVRCAGRQNEERVGRSRRGNSIPANRMMLYKGMRQYQMQHAASFCS